MYTGDFIFSRALVSIGEIEMASVHQLLAETMLEICKGEIIQIDHQRKIIRHSRDYLRRIKRKTALLFSSSCELGALVSDADPAVVGKNGRFGYFAGMAFQIADDILDITSTDEKLGKPAGSDLLNGHLTLPILYIKDDPTFQPFLTRAFEGTLTEDGTMEDAYIYQEYRCDRKIAEVSDLYLKKAIREIENLPDNDAKKAFRQIAAFIGKRKF